MFVVGALQLPFWMLYTIFSKRDVGFPDVIEKFSIGKCKKINTTLFICFLWFFRCCLKRSEVPNTGDQPIKWTPSPGGNSKNPKGEEERNALPLSWNNWFTFYSAKKTNYHKHWWAKTSVKCHSYHFNLTIIVNVHRPYESSNFIFFSLLETNQDNLKV